MDSLELVRILILSNQIHAINKLLSILRNEGVELKAQVASNNIELNTQIKFQNWDLILYCEDSPLSIDILAETLKTQGIELPIIFLADINSQFKTAELFSIGINDCLPVNEKSKIVTSIKREIGFQRLKLSYRLLQFEFKELEKRHQAIMDASIFPLAYIQEGMHLYCNESYAQIFSTSSPHTMNRALYLIFLKEKAENN